MENEITYFEYWKEVRELAKSIVNKEDYNEFADIYDILHESVDSHNWVIYTHKCFQIMEHTKNENALLDDICSEVDSTHGWSSIVTQFAFWAFYQDISDAMSEILIDA